jgi:hypothetical protein
MLPRVEDAGGANRRRLARSLAGALLAVLVALLLRAPIAAIPFERDEGVYAYVGWRGLEGEWPYRDVFDQKPPAIFAAYALLVATLGASPEAIHWGAQVWLCAAQLALFGLGSAWLGPGLATAAALLFALITSSPGFLGNAANVEAFALLPLVAGAWLARRGATRASRGSAALAGAAGAIALLFKPVALPLVLFSLLLLVVGAPATARRRIGLAAWFCAGATAGTLPALLALASSGALESFYESNVRFNLAYGSAISPRDYVRYFWLGIQASLPTLGPVYLAATLSGVGVLSDAAGRGMRGWLWGWLAASLLAAMAGGYFRQHSFLFAAPALALLAAVGCADLLRLARLPAWLRQHGAWIAALAMIAFAVLAAPWYYRPGSPDTKARALYGTNPFADAPDLARFLAQRSGPEDRLFVFGSEPELHVYAKRRNASRYLLAYHYLMGDPEDARRRQREVLDSLRTEPPHHVVLVLHPFSLLESNDTPRDLERGLAALLREQYRPVASMQPRAEGPSPLETRETQLAPWRDAAALERGERDGSVVVYERWAVTGSNRRPSD